MSNKVISLIILLGLFACPGFSQTNQATAAAHPQPLDGCKQMLLVTTSNWFAVTGTMRRFERTNMGSPWVEVGRRIPIVVGRKGLGWGRGLDFAGAYDEPFTHRRKPIEGIFHGEPVKREGDGKSPAGIFRLSSAFGLMPADKIKPLKLPYQYLSEGIECVDDVNSKHYNSIVDRTQTTPADWYSSEKMRTVAQYRLGVVVDHNMDPREAGGGSCIFIHIWAGPETGTSGCTAMASENIDAVVPWLDPAAAPTLVQLPYDVCVRLKATWALP